MITVAEARGGIYIDFEGPRDHPSILCVLYAAQGDAVVYEQHILQKDLHPAAALTQQSKVSTPLAVAQDLLDRSIRDGRRILAWSEYEEKRLREQLGDEDPGVVESIDNARSYAETWIERAHPTHPSRKRKKGERNKLSMYLDLVGYQRVLDDRDYKPIAGISEMRAELTRTRGRLPDVAHGAVEAWRKTLLKNYDDCAGMRAVMIHVAEQEEARPKPAISDFDFDF